MSILIETFTTIHFTLIQFTTHNNNKNLLLEETFILKKLCSSNR